MKIKEKFDKFIQAGKVVDTDKRNIIVVYFLIKDNTLTTILLEKSFIFSTFIYVNWLDKLVKNPPKI